MSELTPPPETVKRLEHQSGTGPWILLSEWSAPTQNVKCMGRRGEIKEIPRASFVGTPSDMPFAELPPEQRKNFCKEFGHEDLQPTATTLFEQGKRYTRKQINGSVGGQIASYLPTVNGIVVCGCFDPSANPEAPAVVLPGNTKDVVECAERAATARHPIPIFLKRGANKWEFVGVFRPTRFSREETDFAQRAAAAKRKDVSGALFLEPAEA